MLYMKTRVVPLNLTQAELTKFQSWLYINVKNFFKKNCWLACLPEEFLLQNLTESLLFWLPVWFHSWAMTGHSRESKTSRRWKQSPDTQLKCRQAETDIQTFKMQLAAKSLPGKFLESWNVARKVKQLGTLVAAQQLSPSVTDRTQDFVWSFQWILVHYLLVPLQWTDVMCNIAIAPVLLTPWRLWRAAGFVVCALRNLGSVQLILDLGLITCAVRKAGTLDG